MEPDNYAAVVRGGGKALDRQGNAHSARRVRLSGLRVDALRMQGESAPPGRLRLRCELDQAQIQLTFTANTTCPADAGLSEPVSVHCNPPWPPRAG